MACAICGASTWAMAFALAALAMVRTFDTPAICCGFGGDAGRIGGEHDDVDGFGVQRFGGRHALGGGRIEFAVEMFGDDENLGHGDVL
jgi:hypothetical protein